MSSPFCASTRSRIGRRGCTGSICQSIVASCFDWSSRRNKLVTDGLNFPSNDYIYHGVTRQGAEIVSVASVDGMTVSLERILEAIDERTQLVSISHVAFRSSYLHLQDLAAIAARAHELGGYLVADLYQIRRDRPARCNCARPRLRHRWFRQVAARRARRWLSLCPRQSRSEASANRCGLGCSRKPVRVRRRAHRICAGHPPFS